MIVPGRTLPRAVLASLGLWARAAGETRGTHKIKIPVGGQAVIEGVLMKGESRWGLAVRRPDGEIFEESWPNSSRTKRYPWKLPIFRGVVTMIEMVGVGFRALGRSAEVALGEAEEELTKKDIAIAVSLGILVVVGLFIALPMWLSEKGAAFLGFPASAIGRNVLEGLLRGVIFVGYVAVIGLWGDIRQVFRYHGAEHKTINAFENTDFGEAGSDGGDGEKMTPEFVAAQSRIHPRCGTSFLLIAILIGIAVFSVVGGGGILWRIGMRVALLPLVVGISYEIIRLSSRSEPVGRWGLISKCAKCLMYPALSLQYLTTREPDSGQIEVAMTSLDIALGRRG
jgi:uncharacterized protein YqhQ